MSGNSNKAGLAVKQTIEFFREGAIILALPCPRDQREWAQQRGERGMTCPYVGHPERIHKPGVGVIEAPPPPEAQLLGTGEPQGRTQA